MLALARFEAGLCDCGFHESLTTDPSNHFTFDVRTCPVCKGSAQFDRTQKVADEAERKQRGDKPPPGSPDPADGRKTYTRLMTPDEVSQRRSKTWEVTRGRS